MATPELQQMLALLLARVSMHTSRTHMLHAFTPPPSDPHLQRQVDRRQVEVDGHLVHLHLRLVGTAQALQEGRGR